MYTHKKRKCFVRGCEAHFKSVEEQEEHMRSHDCGVCLETNLDLRRHICVNIDKIGGAKEKLLENTTVHGFSISTRQHRGVLALYELDVSSYNITQVSALFTKLNPRLESLLKYLLVIFKPLVVSFRLAVDLIEISTNTRKSTHIGLPFFRLEDYRFIQNLLLRVSIHMIHQLNIYNEGKSQWSVTSINRIDCLVGQMHQMAPGLGYIRKPESLKHKKGLIDIKGARGFCFHYCILHSLWHDDLIRKFDAKCLATGQATSGNLYDVHKYRMLRSGKMHLDLLAKNMEVNFDCITQDSKLGVLVTDIQVFEDNNNISVTVYGYNEECGEIEFLRTTSTTKEHHVNLLYITAEEKGYSKGHYILIHNLQAFTGSRGRKKIFYCKYCHQRYRKEHTVISHELTCGYNLDANPDIKEGLKYFKFSKPHTTMMIPYVLYATMNVVKKPKNTNFFSARPYAYVMALYEFGKQTSEFKDFEEPFFYYGPNAPLHFLKKALEISVILKTKVENTNYAATGTEEENKRHLEATNCDLCGLPFTHNDKKTFHHHHLINGAQRSNYLGSLHQNACNLQVKHPPCITVILHDGVQLIPQIISAGLKDSIINSQQIHTITNSKGIVTGITINGILRLQDNKQYYPSQLGETDEIIEDLIMDGLELFETKNTRLVPKLIIQKMKTKLKLNTLQMADCLTFWRNMWYDKNRLDMLHYWSISSFALDSCFFKTKQEVEYVREEDHLQLVKELLRPEVSILTKRVVTANSEFCGSYDPEKKPVILSSFDVSSCYGSVMQGYLPYGHIKTMSEEDLAQLDYGNIPENTGQGYVIKCTLSLPEKLHDYFNNFPLWPEYCRTEFQLINSTSPFFVGSGKKTPKLTLFDKREKTYYYKSVNFLIRQGFVLEGIPTSGIRFSEAPYMASFVNEMIHIKNEAKSSVVKNTAKHLVNTISGKMLQNLISGSTKQEYVYNEERAKRLICRSDFLSFDLIDDETSIFKYKIGKFTEQSLGLVGATIIELAKLKLYSFFYDNFKPVFGPRVEVISSHVDSLYLVFYNTDQEFIEGLNRMPHIFDFNSLSPDCKLREKVTILGENKGQPGLLKPVHLFMKEYAGIRPTCYSVISHSDNGGEETKIAGIPRTEKDIISHETIKRLALQHLRNTEVVIRTEKREGKVTFIVKDETNAISVSDLYRTWESPSKSYAFGHKKFENLAYEPIQENRRNAT